MSEFEVKMSALATQRIEWMQEMERLKANMEQNALQMQRVMREHFQWVYRYQINENESLQVEINEDFKRRLDKDQLASDLNVKKSQLKTPFLLEQVERQRLTAAQYERYFVEDQATKFTVKRKKPRKGKKKG